MRQAVEKKQIWRMARNLAAGLMLLCPWPLAALKPAPSPPGAPQMRLEVRGQAAEAIDPQLPTRTQAPSQRDIVDPCVGTRWQLVADSQHPERPGRLVPVYSGVLRASNPIPAGLVRLPTPSPPAMPAIHAGDRIAVSQQTPVLRARFQAVALESAAFGQTFRVRLLGGAQTLTGNQGTVVDVRAIRAGEAVWLSVEGQPQ